MLPRPTTRLNKEHKTTLRAPYFFMPPIFSSHLQRKLIRLAARLTQVNFELRAHKNIKKLQTENRVFEWQATNDDPQFLLKKKGLVPRLGRKKFRPGWYALQTELKHVQATHHMAKLYVNYGHGLEEENTILLPLRPQKRTTRIFYLKAQPAYLRLDPTETEGAFHFKTLKLIQVPRFYAVHRQLLRIKTLHPDYQGIDYLSIAKQIWNKAKRASVSFSQSVLNTYNQTFTNFQVEKDYGQWIKKTERPKLEKFLHTQLCNPRTEPLISLVLPCYNTDPKLLKACIDSVTQQDYPSWQLCIVDDASTSHAHLEVIQKAQTQHPNIQFHARKENGHISQASNDALAMAKGEYSLLLDHDDQLAQHALTLFVDAINKHPQAKLFYADEDKIDEDGHRFMPHFKPDWNPDLLTSQNYIGHPVMYQTQHLKSIEGFRVGVEGSQDHDLLLRYTQNLSADEIVHLPWILYHWRATENSTAQNTGSKNYTTQAGIKALQDHFDRQKLNVSVTAGSYANTYRCQWPLPEKRPLVSLLIPTRDGHDILKACIESILEKTTYKNYEILILNNQSTCSKTLALFDTFKEQHSNVRVLDWNHPFNYSAINNFGVEQSKGEVIGLINNDIEVITSDWLEEMVSHAIRPDIGCVGAKLFYPNDTIQHAGVILGIGGVAGHNHKYFAKVHPGYFSRLALTQNLSAVTAACLVVEKSIYQQVNGLDEDNLPVAFNDVDFCLKVQEIGYNNLFTPWAELYHHESISRGAEDTSAKQRRAQKEISFMKHKWHTQLHHDPAYNRNLTLTYENFSLR